MTNFINFIQPTNYALLIKKPEISDLSSEDQKAFRKELKQILICLAPSGWIGNH